MQRATSQRVVMSDIHCGLGPDDRPYPERHSSWTIAVVRSGRFSYRAHDAKLRELSPGWVLLGRDGAEFECHHTHVNRCGDDCTAVRVSVELVEDVRRGVSLRGGTLFPVAVLPPVPRIDGAIATASKRLMLRGEIDADALAMSLVEGVLDACGAETDRAAAREPSRRDRERVAQAIAAVDERPDDSWPIAELAARVGASPYHFARAFRAVAGTTPHQYVVAARLRRAAQLLLDTRKRISEIAYEVGFGDLSNFVHTFRRAMGKTPREFRRGVA